MSFRHIHRLIKIAFQIESVFQKCVTIFFRTDMSHIHILNVLLKRITTQN